MKKKIYISVKFKLTFVTTVLLALISLFIYYYFPERVAADRLENLSDKANTIAQMTAYNISNHSSSRNKKQWEKDIDDLLINESIRYLIIYKDNSIQYEFNIFTAVLSDYTNLENNVSEKWKTLKAYSPIIQNDIKVGDIYLGLSLSSVYESINDLRKNIAIVSIILFLISVFAVYFITKLFTEPLTIIVDAVKNISEGDLNQNITIKSYDEMAFLADSINDMSEKLAKSNREMDKITRELESRVNDRTKKLEDVLETLRLENTQRKKAELEITSSLHEKEILLKEIHHRVKNNLQIVSSLIFFQLKQISDPEMLEMLRDGQNRVKTMALIHERLYQSGDLANIDFREYLKKLTTFLMQSYGVNQAKIKLRLNVHDIKISVDTAVPCGLIVNELISNSLKHGFKNRDSGEIRVDMGFDEANKLIMKISDNGVGFPHGLKIEKTDSLGLRLVQNLTKQINGKAEFYNNNGTIVKITFSQPVMKKAS